VKFSKEFSTALEQSLDLLAAAFHHNLTTLEVQAYAIGLEGVQPKHIRLATKYLLKTHLDFMPPPARLREALKAALEKESQESVPECADCGSTGFVITTNPDTGYRLANMCHCRKPGGTDATRQPGES
jgi:hypothetical protein